MNSLEIPAHIGIILDGNRRWAKTRGLSVMDGHKAGFETLKRVAEHGLDRGVKELTVYAFSSENWQRAAAEVHGLMDLFRWVVATQLQELHEKNIRVRIVGERAKIDADLATQFDEAEKQTAKNSRGILNVLVNYGGRADILNAVKKLLQQKVNPAELGEARFAAELSTAGMSEPDLVIRTSEARLSNFLTWETVYSEIYFAPDILWPDFDEAALDEAISFYQKRQRRFGE